MLLFVWFGTPHTFLHHFLNAYALRSTGIAPVLSNMHVFLHGFGCVCWHSACTVFFLAQVANVRCNSGICLLPANTHGCLYGSANSLSIPSCLAPALDAAYTADTSLAGGSIPCGFESRILRHFDFLLAYNYLHARETLHRLLDFLFVCMIVAHVANVNPLEFGKIIGAQKI